MSDEEQEESQKPFAVERAKTGRAKCKKCKCPIDKDNVRIAKIMRNPFGEGTMKAWHHITCLFDVFAKQRASTKRIDNPEEDINGWDDLTDEDKDLVLKKLEEFENNGKYPFCCVFYKHIVTRFILFQIYIFGSFLVILLKI